MLTRLHDRRLRALYRSAGWPCQDGIEIDLLAAGLLERVFTPGTAEYLRLTDAGLQRLAQSLQRNRAALDRHQALVQRVAEDLVRAGRLVYCDLTLLTRPGEQWLHLRPDVYSIRNTTVEDYVEPVVHEIKVQRSDLRADLKNADKRAGYIALSSECYYVLSEGIAEPDDVPPECGVLIARAQGGLELARASPKRAQRLGFTQWMALAKAERYRSLADPEPLL